MTRSWSVAPSLKLTLGSSWQARLTGVFGTSDVHTVADTYFQDIFLDQARGRYTNHFRSVEVTGEGPLFRLTGGQARLRSEEHTSELQSLMRISYAVFCLTKKKYNSNS